VNTREIMRTSRLLSHEIGVFPQPNKAIVGRNAFAHEAGIHQHGMLQNGLTYEIISPETVGAGGSSIVLGKHSGRHALERRYKDLGYEPDAETLEQLYQAFTALADKKRQILDEDLLTLLHEGFNRAPEVYNLTHLRVTCGTDTASAEVQIAGPGFTGRRAAAPGNGPIAAAFAAIAEAVGRTIEVLDLSVQSVTPGRDSLGRVILQVRVDGKSLSGHGASTDIVEAGARALIHALNKADHADGLETAALSSSYFWGV
jgi:2-isopropylmalate synthase